MILPLLAFSFFLNASHAQSVPEKFTVIARSHSGKQIYEEVELPQLLDARYAETADFKIVEQKDEKPLEWKNLSDEDRLRAANLIYHLSIAKQFFTNQFQAEEVRRLGQVVIRINFTNDFNKLAHWSNDTYNPQYNTAHSIPAGKGNQMLPAGPNGEGVKTPVSWSNEIWFRPAKMIPVKGILAKMAEDPLNPTIRDARDAVYPTQISSEVQNGFRYMFGDGYSSQQFLNATTRQIGVVAMIEGAFLLMKQVNRALLPNHYYIDAAMVPEVIYHEFSHVAFSEYLNPTVGTPLIEGVADYFAALIADSPKLAMNIKRYAQGYERNGKQNKVYGLETESRHQSTSGFALSLLWGLHNVKKGGIGKEETTKVVLAALRNGRMSTYGSELRSSLAHEMRLACEKVCTNPIDSDWALIQYFDKRFNNL